MRRDSWHRLCWLGIFGLSMGFFEAAVVVYLRRLLCPQGFSFPLVPLDKSNELIMAVEVAREATSILMLLSVGMLAGRRGFERFMFFLCGFGVWDLVYYLFLKLILNWPATLATWDVLFLVPLPWVAPVWAPAVLALLFILTTIIFLHQEDRDRPLRPSPLEWALAITGALIAMVSFCWDGPLALQGGVPCNFHWGWWMLGLILALVSFFSALRRANRFSQR